MKTSVIIPSCNEKFLQQTIASVLGAAIGEVEVIAYLDGYWPQPVIPDDPRVIIIHDPKRRGMRHAINTAASVAKGDYLCKFDGHCLMDKGFDKVLAETLDTDWIAIPRRYSLDAEKWERVTDNGKVRDAHYLSYPTAFDIPHEYLGFGMHVKDWPERSNVRKDVMVDDDMISQGSCWFMHREYFWKFGGLQEEGYGTFIQESQQLMLRCWLSGGRVVCNKKTWYAHLWKGKKYGRMYDLSRVESKAGEIYSADFWFNNRWTERIHDIEWLIDKFWPVPTWPDGWTSKDVSFPEPSKVIVNVPEISKPVPEKVSVKMTRNQVVSHILKRFSIEHIDTLPIEIDLNRSQWGKLFNELGFKTGAEIGVFGGEYSECLCRENPGVEHFAIDPWVPYPEYVNHRKAAGLCSAEEEARERLAPFNCKIIKAFSMEAVKQFKDNSLDYVYIDGNHDFQNVTNDIVEWQKKVRPGGIVAGHDYDKHKFSSRCHVLQVVRGYTEAVGVYPWFIMSNSCKTNDTDGNGRTSWMWIKA